MPFVPHTPTYASMPSGTARLAPAEFDRTQAALASTTALADAAASGIADATALATAAAASVTKTVTLGEDGAANVTLINAAVATMNTSGKLNGTLVLRGKSAPIASTLTMDCGYPNITQTLASSGERFKLVVDGSLTFASGIGIGLLVKSGYGTVVDVKVQGGGSSTDVAVQVQDHLDLDLSVEGAAFAGILLKGDAYGDTTKRVRTSLVRKVQATNCGQAIYWRNIEAFGQFQHIWDNNCVNGAQFITCADTHIAFYENYSPPTHTIGLDFDDCGAFQIGVITLGGRAATLMRVRGGDLGRINQIRVSGDPATSGSRGLLLEGVHSVDIDNVNTFRCAVGVEVRGTAYNGGIHIKQHRSMTSDIVPLMVSAGTTGESFLTIRADYRSTTESIQVGPGVTSGFLNISGIIRDMYVASSGAGAGRYAIEVDSTSGGLKLNVDGLKEYRWATGMAGFTNHPTPANVTGMDNANIQEPFTHGAVPVSAGLALGTAWRNNTTRTVALVVAATITDPGVGNTAGITWAVGPTSSPTTVGDDLLTADPDMAVTSQRILRTLIVPPYWYAKATLTGSATVAVTTSTYYSI